MIVERIYASNFPARANHQEEKMSRPSSSYEVVYLTGAPASGKSSLARGLKKSISPLIVYEYGKVLTDYLNKGKQKGIRQEHLRKQSSNIAKPSDIKAVDDYLLRHVSAKRGKMHVIIDSHAVTKESYGFRVTSFRLDQVANLSPTFIVCLYADAQTTRSRIQVNAQGRPQISIFEADFHTHLQSSVALSYGTQLGVPVYLLDSATPREQLVKWFRSKLS